MGAKKKRVAYVPPEPPKWCRHSYGGYHVEEGWDGEPRCILRCSKCKQDYHPNGYGRLLGNDDGHCPHPMFGRRNEKGEAKCAACGRMKRFLPMKFVGGPRDGEIDWFLPTFIEDPWVYPMSMTSKGQEPDKQGRTILFSYRLGRDADGWPIWDGRDREPPPAVLPDPEGTETQ